MWGRKGKLFGSKRVHVAICSRDSEVNFQWLKDLMAKDLKPKVKSVGTVYVTNDSSQFYEEMSHYTFAVLYHTRKRGRINVTNVTDSLYDEELKFLHKELGKKNVIVVIDDLESSTEEDKKRILRDQEDIKEFSADLFLFTEDKKNIFVHSEPLKRVIKEAKNLKRTKEKKSKKKRKSQI